ncbi:DUF1173 family protein [Cupriavidus necator]
MITVRIGGNELPLEDVLENPGRHSRQLERAKTTQGFAECGCVTARPRPKLVIRRHRDIFLLARWPDQAQLHGDGCPLQRRNASKGGAGSDLDAFRVGDGRLDIKLDATLSVSSRTPAKPVKSSPDGEAKKPQRCTAGLLAFLEYAWELAGLNQWPGAGGRGWSACWSQLTAELADCRINGQSAGKILHVMERWDSARKSEILAELDAWIGRLTPSGETSPRGLLVGEIDSHKPTQFGGKIVLRQSLQRFFMGAALYQRLLLSHTTALAGVGQQDQRCVAILLVERSRSNYLTIVDAAAMLTNAQFLPCDSGHEVAMADHLVAQRRAFRKPLRHIGNAPVHPDFVLTDTSPEAVIGPWDGWQLGVRRQNGGKAPTLPRRQRAIR